MSKLGWSKEHLSASVQKSLMELPDQYLQPNEKHAKYVLLAVPERKESSASWGVLRG